MTAEQSRHLKCVTTWLNRKRGVVFVLDLVTNPIMGVTKNIKNASIARRLGIIEAYAKPKTIKDKQEFPKPREINLP
jgi:hypothetical protein